MEGREDTAERMREAGRRLHEAPASLMAPAVRELARKVGEAERRVAVAREAAPERSELAAELYTLACEAASSAAGLDALWVRHIVLGAPLRLVYESADWFADQSELLCVDEALWRQVGQPARLSLAGAIAVHAANWLVGLWHLADDEMRSRAARRVGDSGAGEGLESLAILRDPRFDPRKARETGMRLSCEKWLAFLRQAVFCHVVACAAADALRRDPGALFWPTLFVLAQWRGAFEVLRWHAGGTRGTDVCRSALPDADEMLAAADALMSAVQQLLHDAPGDATAMQMARTRIAGACSALEQPGRLMGGEDAT